MRVLFMFILLFLHDSQRNKTVKKGVHKRYVCIRIEILMWYDIEYLKIDAI